MHALCERTAYVLHLVVIVGIALLGLSKNYMLKGEMSDIEKHACEGVTFEVQSDADERAASILPTRNQNKQGEGVSAQYEMVPRNQLSITWSDYIELQSKQGEKTGNPLSQVGCEKENASTTNNGERKRLLRSSRERGKMPVVSREQTMHRFQGL